MTPNLLPMPPQCASEWSDPGSVNRLHFNLKGQVEGSETPSRRSDPESDSESSLQWQIKWQPDSDSSLEPATHQ
jgi:hypothetical protein